MNKQILAEKDADLMEEIVVKFGNVVTFEQVYGLLASEYSRQYVRVIISKLVKKGWFIRIKQGLYTLSNLFNRGNTTLPQYILAHLIASNSYVSFGHALQYHGMFDQLLKTIASISLRQYDTKKLLGYEYKFIKTQKRYFFGWKEVSWERQTAKIALPEKALIDMVQFSRTTVSVDTVLEKLIEFNHQINLQRLDHYLESPPLAVQKIFGFLFDLLKIDSDRILERTRKNTSRVYIDAGNKNYNDKWNIYFDEIFMRYMK